MAITFANPDQVDPGLAWQPWQPTANDPWGRKWAAHLYRRAGFGPSREDLIEAERLGFEGTLDRLLRGRPDIDQVEETLAEVGRIAAERDDSGDLLRGWWLYRMLLGGHALREKMTLFWHDHFATSLAKVLDPVLMFRQNGLIRQHALGRFGPFLQAMSKDPAMLIWLDSNTNAKSRPNENYARELMELFSLGVGHFSETDIREAARAFTGWRTDGERFVFDARLHDGGPKTVLRQTGAWDGVDVVRILLEQPATARFLVRKLYRFFVSERTTPADSLLDPLCEAFRASDYDISALVRTILASRHFYSSNALFQKIKGPVEYVLGAVQAVYRRYGEEEAEYRPMPERALMGPINAMGQVLFAPPNVKGWPGGSYWLNTSTRLERDNFAEALAMGTLWHQASTEPAAEVSTTAHDAGPVVREMASSMPTRNTPEEPAPPRAFDPARLLQDEDVSRPEDVVRSLLDLYLPGGVRPDVRAKLVAFMARGKPAGAALDRRVREAVHAILAMAESQLA